MTSQTEKQLQCLHCATSHGGNIGNQAVKFGQIIKYITLETFFFKTQVENKARTIAPDLFLFFKKTLYRVKAMVSTLVKHFCGP